MTATATPPTGEPTEQPAQDAKPPKTKAPKITISDAPVVEAPKVSEATALEREAGRKALANRR